MSSNSTYVQLSPYLLLEYIYADSSTTYVSSEVKLARIDNAYLDGQCQFLNTSPSVDITQNVLNNSAANLGASKWAYLSNNAPVPYINLDSNLTFTELSSLLTSVYSKYDTVKVHILSGYRLEDIQGLILQIYAKEAQSGLDTVLTNNVYLNSDSRDILNARPIMLGDRMYDRYIEVQIPSIKDINDNYYGDPSNVLSLGYQYTSDHRGILFNSSIYVKIYEITSLEKTNGITYFYTSEFYEVNVNQEDFYSSLQANIEEASDGDYFNYYPSYASDFVADFIESLNVAGGDYVLINDIDVYEQVGADSLLTFSFSQVQLAGFDGPLTFRPIMKYASSAVAFSIDYTVRIFNRENSFQFIRRASTTSYNVRKYGKELQRIKLAEQTYPFKVYNKIYSGPTLSYTTQSSTNSFSTVYVPVFFDSKNLIVDVKSILATGADPLSPDFSNSILFGQGDARIYLSDFDSYFKFSIKQVEPKTGAHINVNLSASVIELAFKDKSGKMIKVASLDSNLQTLLSNGEVSFKVNGYLRDQVLYDDSVKNFYIISVTTGFAETLIYTGTVDKSENIHLEQNRLKDLSGKLTISNISDVNLNSVTGQPFSLTQQLTNANNIITTPGNSEQVQPIVIPGFSQDQNAQSIKSGLVPVATKTSNNSLSQGSGAKVNLG